MNFIATEIPDVFIIEPRVFGDERGYFLESFNQEQFDKHIGKVRFVQDNESKSGKGVVRGLHFQKPPYAQAKLVRCIQGEVLDVAVDIRKNSSTYGKYVAVALSDKNKRQLFVPRGFAHGFAVLSNEAVFAYKIDNSYAPDYEGGILWNDTSLQIDWQLESHKVLLSDKDISLPLFKDFKTPF